MNMESHFKPDRKQILSDPAAVYSATSEHTQAEKIELLEHLHKKASELKQQKSEIQLQSKKLSRKIGEAKRNRENISDLKIAMQQLSQQQKTLSLNISELEHEILHFFDTSNCASESKKPSGSSDMLGKDDNSGQRYHAGTNMNIDDIHVSLLSNEEQEWNDYVSRHPAGCFHHRSEWKKILKQSYGHECFYFLAHDRSDKVVGVLPLAHLQSRLFGNLLVSMPYFQRAGAIADHPLIEHKLIQAANQLAAEREIDHIEYRDDIPREGMPVQDHKVNMVLTLPSSAKELWQGFSAKLRAQIKRPQREDPEVQFGRTELLNDFYKVYARNMRDLGSPSHSKGFIRQILELFPDNSWLVVIKLNNKPVGGGFLLADKNTMEIPLASTIRDVNPLSINMLLYWQVLQFAIDKGYRYFDFGRSTRGAGTYRFKKQWGAKAKPLYWHYWLNSGTELPGLNPSNPKYKIVIGIWKKLPIKLTNLIGPLIVKNIP